MREKNVVLLKDRYAAILREWKSRVTHGGIEAEA